MMANNLKGGLQETIANFDAGTADSGALIERPSRTHLEIAIRKTKCQ